MPEEYQKYKEHFAVLRDYGLGLKQRNIYEELIEWLEDHDGKMPKGIIRKDGKVLRREEYSPEELEGAILYQRWNRSKEKANLMACKGIAIDELPKEYEEYKNQFAILRSYGIGVEEKSVGKEIIEWIQTHGKMPRSVISKNGKQALRSEMTKEEQEEIYLYYRWLNSPERTALEECKGLTLDEIPEEYKEYSEEIAALREYGLGVQQESLDEKIIKWLEQHNGKLPRGQIRKEGIQLKVSAMTDEEREEVVLYQKWTRSKLKEALDACRRNSIR